MAKKSSFAKDVLKLVSGTTLAQAIAVCSAPFLTRLYGPDVLGVSALFVSITETIKVISCLRYEQSIVLPQDDEEGVNLLGSSLVMTVFITLLTTLVFAFGTFFIANGLNAPELAQNLWLVPVAVFAGGIFLALNYWNTRTKNFGRLSGVQVANVLVITGIQLGMGYNGHPTSASLIWANVMGAIVATSILGYKIWKSDIALIRRSLRWATMWQGIKRYRKFPLYDMWAILFNTVSWQLPSLLLAAFFSRTEVGYYAMSFRVLALPMSVIGNALGQVFLQRAAEARAEGNLAELVELNFRRLVVTGLFPFLLLVMVGRDVFAIVLGAQWAEAGVYAQILSVWVFFWFISSPLSSLFRVLEKQEFNLGLNITILVTRAAALVIGGLLGNARLTIVLFSASGILVYGYLSLAIVHVAGVSWVKAGKILVSNLLVFIPVGLLVGLLQFLQISTFIVLGVTALCLGIYFLYHGIVTYKFGVYVNRFLSSHGVHKTIWGSTD